jgi:hypothetical protein
MDFSVPAGLDEQERAVAALFGVNVTVKVVLPTVEEP